MKKILILITTALFLISVQSGFSFTKDGNGNVTQDEREVSGFTKVVVESIGNVYIKQGTAHYLRVDTDSNLQEHIETKVRDNVLFIDVNKAISPSKLNVYVTIVDLEKVKIEGSGNVRMVDEIKSDKLYFETYGSGDIEAQKLKGQFLSIEVRGSGDVEIGEIKFEKLDNDIIGSGDISITGLVDRCRASILGSGDMFMEDCKINKLKAKIAGSGDIMATVKSELLVKIYGSGDVYYKGDPQRLKIESMGSGEALKI